MAFQAQIPGGAFVNETNEYQSQIPGSTFINQTVPVVLPSITSVGGDNSITSSELNVPIVGVGFGSIQGTSSITITQGAISSSQSIDSWSDTAVQFDTTQGGLRYGSTTVLTLVTNEGYSTTTTITFTVPSGYAYTNFSGYPASSGDIIGSSITIPPVDGDQIEYETTASNSGVVTVNADGTYSVSIATPCTFTYRIWYAATSTWSVIYTASAYTVAYKTIVLSPPAGKGFVNLSGYPASSPALVVGTGATPSLVDGDQVEYDLLSNLGNAVSVYPDGTFLIDAAVTSSFTYRVWDASDSTWSNTATITVTV